ncbi:MAG: DUF3025 domain-containing protein [Burkholderiales bacterium]|nr:DUF3025 domain-containing protein [Burkholderiales bacterium]
MNALGPAPEHPCFAWLRPALDRAWAARQGGLTVAQALAEAGAAPVRFVPQHCLPPGEAYEAYIARTGCVPTRDNLHDFFNGLVWLQAPALKLRLNALHADEIGRRGIGPERGALRDALTLFDENGALLEAPAVLRDALRARDWRAAFVAHRARWAEARLTLIGHALLEQLARAPRKPLTAHVLAGDALAWRAEHWRAKPFSPLPVLGVPGWWPANEDPAFYDDAAVFRPPRIR